MFPDIGPVWIFRQDGMDGSLPNDLSAFGVDAQQMSLEVPGTAGITPIRTLSRVARDEDTVTRDTRAGRTMSGQRSLPLEILRPAPGDRQILFIAYSRAIRTAKAWPVRSKQYVCRDHCNPGKPRQIYSYG